MIKLYGWWSTNPQKVRMALEELSLDYQYKEVNLGKGEHRETAYRAIHPRAKVPALEIDDLVLWESGAALMYLATRESRLWPQSRSDIAQAMNLLVFESSAFQDPAGVHFFNGCILPSIGKAGDPTRVEKAKRTLVPQLALLSRQLGSQDFLLGDLTVVDLAFAPWLPWLDLEGHANLLSWRQRLTERESWQACGVREPQG
jgi:glutathione S-transferase